jgi:hypothetical protein
MGWTLDDVTKPYGDQLAIKLRVVETDVTSEFKQAIPAQPGRYVFSAKEYEPSGGWAANQFVFHYQLEPYLTDWDAYAQYGKFEGTYKDDSLTTQAALLAAGSQYLQSVSQPTVTISLSATDLYDLNPELNPNEELTIAGTVTVIDDVLGIEQECVIAKIDKNDMTQPHTLDTLTLNNVHLSASKLMAQLGKTAQRSPKYLQGQTVETPYTTAVAASSTSPGTSTFTIRDITTLTHAVRLTIDTPTSFTLTVDGTPLGQTFAGYSNVDITQYLKQSHNGQPTSGEHYVTVLPSS